VLLECYLRSICRDLRKGKKRKQDERLVESQKGALHKFFQLSSNADLNEDQEQEPDEMQENDHNLNAEVQANENVGGEQNLSSIELGVNGDSTPEENLQASSSRKSK